MALVNPQIAMSYRPTTEYQPRNALAEYAQIQNIMSGQRQAELAQYQLSTAQREDAATNALNAAYRDAYNAQTGDIDINKLRQSLSAGGFGSKLPGIEKTLAELKKERLTQQKLEGEIAGQPLTRQKLEGEIAGQALTRQKLEGEIAGQPLARQKLEGEIAGQAITQSVAQANLVEAKLKQARSFLDTIDPTNPNAPQQYIAWHEANHRDPVLGPLLASRGITADQSRAQIAQAIQQGPQAFAELVNKSKLGTEKFMELNRPQVTAQTLGGTVRAIQVPGLGGAATVVPGSEAAVTMTPAQIEQDKRDRERIKQEGQRIGLEGRRVKVLEENQRRDADPAFQQRMANARVTGEAIAKGDVAALQALPKLITRAEEGLRLIDEMVGKQEVRDASGKVIQAATKPHPGFENAVGTTWLPGARFVAGTDAADFQARFDQIKGASFLEAFESLKGGGAITETEGTKATAAINRMALAQSEKEFVSAARDLQEVVRKGVANAQRKAGGGGGASPAGGVDMSNPLLKK